MTAENNIDLGGKKPDYTGSWQGHVSSNFDFYILRTETRKEYAYPPEGGMEEMGSFELISGVIVDSNQDLAVFSGRRTLRDILFVKTYSYVARVYGASGDIEYQGVINKDGTISGKYSILKTNKVSSFSMTPVTVQT